MPEPITITVRSPGVATLTAGRVRDLAQLEVALRKAGCRPSFRHAPPHINVPLDQLATAMAALDQWLWISDGGTEATLDGQMRRLERHRLAKVKVGTYADNASVAWRALEGFVPPGLLDPHQVIAVAAAADPVIEGLCLFDEQGLGKTLEGIAAFHVMRQKALVQRALIFAPKNMLAEWERDLHCFFPNQYRASLVTGTSKQRRDAIRREADVYVANFEASVSEEAALRSLLRMRAGGALLMVDESFHVKNPEAVRTAAIRRLRADAKRCVVLCGTPAPNAPEDIVEQFNIADGGIAFTGANIPEDPELAKEAIASVIEERGIYLRRLKIDVMRELPGKTFHRMVVPLTPQQRSLYAAMLQDYVADLEQTDANSFRCGRVSFLARRSRLLRTCTDPGGVADGFDGEPAKQLVMDELLADLIDRQEEKVVIWTSYTRSVDALMERYARYSPVRIDGAVTDVDRRRDAIARFQDDDETRIFIGNPAAAGAGITLHRARVAIYEALPVQAAAYFQSLDRIHRRGQERPVDYIVLLAAGTLEITEYDRLAKKARRSRELLGDRDPEDVTRDALLDEALEAWRAIKQDG